MDPNATLEVLIDAATQDGDTQAIMDAAENLIDWLNKGGFKPKDPRS